MFVQIIDIYFLLRIKELAGGEDFANTLVHKEPPQFCLWL